MGNVCSGGVERGNELEIIRRSLAMLTPGQYALRREDAIDLVEELAELTKRLEALRSGLARLIEEEARPSAHSAARRYRHRD